VNGYEKEQRLQIAAPKVEFYDVVTGRQDLWTDIDESAKILNKPGFGRNNLYEFLRRRQGN